MLSGLRHDTLVGGNDKQGKVNTADTGQHVLDETLVTGDIDDANLTTAGELEPGEAKLDGHAPLLLLLEPVGVYPGEGFNQERFTVVDMPGSTHYEHNTPMTPSNRLMME